MVVRRVSFGLLHTVIELFPSFTMRCERGRRDLSRLAAELMAAELIPPAGAEAVTFDRCVIATGATTKLLPGTSLSERVVTYEEQIMTGLCGPAGTWHSA